ncbi:ubiquinone biosynthesis hydrox [Nemania sp. FL0916]|nr:ubiquinone biosynthesis hydrox [Nemania sp. FL0916]
MDLFFRSSSKGVAELERKLPRSPLGSLAPQPESSNRASFDSTYYLNRSLSIRSGKSGATTSSPTHRKGFSFASLRGSIQPELSRRLYRLIKSTNNLISSHESAGKERDTIARELSEWGEQTQDEAVSDISDKVGVILSELGAQEESYAHNLDDARGILKTIRNTEKSVQPSRDNKGKIADEIQKIKIKEPQSTRLVILEQELVRAEAENLVAEAQLHNITRKKLKEAYDLEFAAVIERAEKQIILAKHGQRLLSLLDDSPITPGDARRVYEQGSAARQVLNDAEDDLKSWESNRRHEPVEEPVEEPEVMTDIYDVVCVGGGPAGLSLLAALSTSMANGRLNKMSTEANPTTAGLRVALIEAQDLSKLRSWQLPSDRFSNRCSSLTPSSAVFLNKIGAWRHLQRDRVQPYHEMQVWDGVSDARIEFEWAPGSASSDGTTIAYMVENLNLTSALLKRTDDLSGVATFDGARVENITFGEETDELDFREWPIVHLQGGKQLAARLLVGADGANSPVRAFAGIDSKGWDYDRQGVVATLELEGNGWGGDDMKIAYQRFLPTGPIAMLPLPGNYATLVWSTTPSNARLLRSLSAKDFIALVNAAFRLDQVDLEFMHTMSAGGQEDELSWRLPHTRFDAAAVPQQVVGVQEGTVASFPLKMRHADTYVGERVALVGDAAHTIHPLAGQGLNQGQADVESLARVLDYAVAHGMDVGARTALEPYDADRYAENHLLLGVVDKLHKLYSVGGGPLVPLRSWGLSAVNGLAPLKSFFMRQAAGRGIKVP